MGGIDQGRANNIVDASLGTAAFIAFTTPAKLKLCSTVSSPTANGTELVAANYTTGGVSLSGNAFGAAVTGQATGPSVSAVTFSPLDPASNKIVAGWELWDSAARRWWFGEFLDASGLPLTVQAGAPFTVGVGAILAGLAPAA